jgi:hypothetical protein
MERCSNQELLKNLHNLYIPQFSRQVQDVKMMQKNLKKACRANADVTYKKLTLDLQTIELCQQRLLRALDEKYLSKVSVLIEQLRVKAVHFRSLLYPQARILLE